MTGTSQIAGKPSRVALALTRIFQLIIVLCLLDGFLDISVSAVRSIMHWAHTEQLRAPAKVRTGQQGDIIKPMPALPADYIPGSGNISKQFASEGIHIDGLGMRSNNIAPPSHPRATAYLFGSSPTFGYAIPDNQTLSAHLERSLGDVRIMNFAGFPQTIPQTVMRYHYVTQHKGKPDFVVIAGLTTDLYLDCFTPPQKSNSSKASAIGSLFFQLMQKNEKPYQFQCGSRDIAEQAIFHSLYNINVAIEHFKKEGIPLFIFILPNAFDPGLNVQNLMTDRLFKENLHEMRSIYSIYRERLNKEHHPEVIDLSRALPADKMYFIDNGGHMSGEAYKILAAQIAAFLGAIPPTQNHRTNRTSGTFYRP